MIIVNLKGGLGNQMFQYALGRKLSLKNSDLLKLETAGLDRANETGDIYRPFSLGAFNIVKNIASVDEVKKLKHPYGLLSKLWRFTNLRVLKRTHTIFEPKILEWRGDIFLDGYWQSPKYFDDIRETLLSEFTLLEEVSIRNSNLLDRIHDGESVSIHVRRGDYANNPQVLREFGVCSKNYYISAIDHIKSKHKNATFFIFSDDMEWVKEHLRLEGDTVHVSGAGLLDTEEMYLMSQCKHNIIANSTFSWWGAWLNSNPAKIVISPAPWFNKVPYDKELIPNTWIQLPKN